ncbi:MAG: hypothetical protein V4736_13865 [Bdellovibrionota bacterium]
MRLVSVIVALSFMAGTSALAESQKQTTTTKVTKKKVMMCEDCGKPESQCECKDGKEHGEKKDHKKDDGHDH